MAKEAFVFDRESVLKLQRMVFAQQQQITNLQAQLRALGTGRHQTSYKPAIVYACKTDEAIPAMSGDVAGSGTATIYRLDVDGTLTSTGKQRTVYNIAEAEVATDTYIQVKEEIETNRLLVDFENCGA